MPTPTLAQIARSSIGHIAAATIRILSVFLPRGTARRSAAIKQTTDLDRTGILLDVAVPLPIAWRDSEVIFPMYEASLAHSFWRSQEFSLFMQHQSKIKPPVLDFGCGDGSFAAVLFSYIEYGSDIDADALKIAHGFNIYENLIHSTDTHIPLPDGSVNSAISNSVLEHVKDLDSVVAEISRVLAIGGVFMFSVPIRQFARDLESLFGRIESEHINTDYYHRNLLEIEEWRSLLDRNGLCVLSLRQFQPDWFSFYYWMLRFLGKRGIGRIIPSIRQDIWRIKGTQFIKMVHRSIGSENTTGGNIFVIAQKGVASTHDSP